MFEFSNFYNFLDWSKSTIKDGLFSLFNFKHFRIYLIILFFLNILAWFLANHIYISAEQDLIYLHSNVEFGVDLIGEKIQIFIIPIFGLIILLFNLLISSFCVKLKDFKFISHLLLASVVMVHAFLLVSLISIYLINFR